MIRRDFLRTMARGAAGLYVANAGIEILEPYVRRLWTGASFRAAPMVLPVVLTEADINRILREMYSNFRHKTFPISTPYLAWLPPGPRHFTVRT